MDIGAPQIILLAVLTWSLAVNFVDHGKTKGSIDATYSGYRATVYYLFWVTLLWWGGFFG